MKFFVLHKPLCPLDSVIHWLALSDRVHNCQNEILDDEIAKKNKHQEWNLSGEAGCRTDFNKAVLF